MTFNPTSLHIQAKPVITSHHLTSSCWGGGESFALNQLSVVSFEVNISVSKMPLTRSNSGRKRKTRQLSFTSNNQDGERTPELDVSVILGSEESQDLAEDPYFEWSVEEVKLWRHIRIFIRITMISLKN